MNSLSVNLENYHLKLKIGKNMENLKETKKRVTFNLFEEDYKKLRDEAMPKGQSISWLIRKIIRAYLEGK